MFGLSQAKHALFMRPWFLISYDNIGHKGVYIDHLYNCKIWNLYIVEWFRKPIRNLVWNGNFKILSANGDTYYMQMYKLFVDWYH